MPVVRSFRKKGRSACRWKSRRSFLFVIFAGSIVELITDREEGVESMNFINNGGLELFLAMVYLSWVLIQAWIEDRRTPKEKPAKWHWN